MRLSLVILLLFFSRSAEAAQYECVVGRKTSVFNASSEAEAKLMMQKQHPALTGPHSSLRCHSLPAAARNSASAQSQPASDRSQLAPCSKGQKTKCLYGDKIKN